MRVSDFHFDLPAELIAQAPLERRDGARMLVVDRASGRLEDRMFSDFPSLLAPGDALVVNNTRVLPARLLGRRAGDPSATQPAHGAVEALLLRQVEGTPPRWEALVRPGRKVRVGEWLEFSPELRAQVVAQGEQGLRTLEFTVEGDFLETLEQVGHVPLPPYIKRPDQQADRERYQTVFAQRSGSAAAPTAGLHFSDEVLGRCRSQGAEIVELTLHVGLGTFQPVKTERLADHRMHAEWFELSASAARSLKAAERVVAVGTTAVRTLETAAQRGAGRIEACAGETDIFLYPGCRFAAVDALLTNFHLPQSTLLMLVCALAGRELMLDAYRHAVDRGYRFFSYGDCMLIV